MIPQPPLTGGSGQQDPHNPNAQNPDNPLKPPVADQSPQDPTHQDPALDQGVLSSDQVPGSPNYNKPQGELIPAWVQLTEDIYWASRPQPIQDLRKLAGQLGDAANTTNPFPTMLTPRYKQARILATQGFPIDLWIDAYGQNPIVAMLDRLEMGIGSILSANGTTTIKTSLDPRDYPPFAPPPPPPPPASVVGRWIGVIPELGGNAFSAGPGALVAYAHGLITNGQKYTDPTTGVAYMAHVQTEGLIGLSIWFTL